MVEPLARSEIGCFFKVEGGLIGFGFSRYDNCVSWSSAVLVGAHGS